MFPIILIAALALIAIGLLVLTADRIKENA